MPHLYLPSEHTDADLVLAADVAAAVSSSDLYVAWTHDAGQARPRSRPWCARSAPPPRPASSPPSRRASACCGARSPGRRPSASRPQLTEGQSRPTGEPSL